MENLQFTSACTQLLSKEDLIVSSFVKEELKKRDFVVDIFKKDRIVIKIYSKKEIILSEIMPILHNMGFLVIDEVSYFIKSDKITYYIEKIHIKADEKTLLLHKKNISLLIEHALEKRILEKCKLFSLTYKENFSIREILLIRAFLSYIDQLVEAFNKNKMIETIVKYSHITRLFLNYFLEKFDPSKENRSFLEIEEKIKEAFKNVIHVNEDRVLKLFLEVLKNVVRTNYFLDKESISLKFNVDGFKRHLKGIQPSIEAFVYHQELQGVHLRMGKISRGGIRWSDRFEDFRVEIKSLMITQEGKNSIIVPRGAKGGFVIFKDREKISREDFIRYYDIFINSLLDLVDNKKDKEAVRDKRVVSYDGDDAYFVVAADRGTSNMSDEANLISQKRGYWLKDAFASGGSYGYHHKKLGITAKGALKSAERFFLERGLDLYEDEISVVGIGSMRGDVFGNGMIMSKSFKLIAAVSHSEVFIDPNPDPLISYEERLRLFKIGGGWNRYDKSKISKGGGVFKRDDKEILISPQIKKVFEIKEDKLDGEELAKRVLAAKVDMIYNGGVGTYFKAFDEENIAIGDKANEFVRLNANEIKAFCVCEGGNLGFTQKARIEYSKNSGRINLDSIDNCAGVNISDHEVNLKILLNTLVDKEVLSLKQRNEQLALLTEQVVNSVLWTNYFQPLSISLDEIRSKNSLEDFLKTIHILEANLPFFKRVDFKIPQDNDFEEVLGEDGAILRPVLSTLLLYSKIFLKNILTSSSMLETEEALEKFLFKYFPKSFVSAYEDEIKSHYLKKEITAMMIANEIINFFGSSFISDYDEIKEEKFLLKIKAYLISNDLFRANDIRYELYRHEKEIGVLKMYPLLLQIEEAILYNLRWMLKGLYERDICYSYILEHQKSIEYFLSILNLPKVTILEDNEKINDFFTKLDYLKLVTGVLIVYKSEIVDFVEIGKIYYIIVDELSIVLLMRMIENLSLKNHSENILKKQLLSLIERLIIDITKAVLKFKRKNESERESVEKYFQEKDFDVEEFRGEISSLFGKTPSITDISILINRLLLL